MPLSNDIIRYPEERQTQKWHARYAVARANAD